ncbi:PIN domain-containing protein [Pleurocapsa sp. FMAR1]|uniref:PIN domain-containing protein n=1 Tax=Pleurocapsa sp. FMAR1 TaxID=3040204 RepID=UPI0029C891A2|nr:PIN domain-containing protein [Pleurocapsa sp. FMAR1]
MTEISALLSKYSVKGILIDTNILLLYLIGLVNRDRIPRFKRTAQFIPEDYDLLFQLVNSFQKVITTPNILTEVNSLANQLGEPERSQCLNIFAGLIAGISEQCLDSGSVAKHELFARFGLTDCAIMYLAKDKYLVLTDDLKLSLHLKAQGIDAINFNNLRTL